MSDESRRTWGRLAEKAEEIGLVDEVEKSNLPDETKELVRETVSKLQEEEQPADDEE